MGCWRSISATIVGVMLLAQASAGHAQVTEPVSLAFQPKVGDQWRKELTTTVTTEGWLGDHDDRSNLLRREQLTSTVTTNTTVTGQEPDGSTAFEMRPVRLIRNTSVVLKDGSETVTSFDTDTIDATLSPEIAEAYRHFADLRYFGTRDSEGRIVDYRVEPEGNNLGDMAATALSKALGDDVATYPDRSVAPGETWTINPPAFDAAIMAGRGGHIRYNVVARLIAVEQRGDSRHALVSMTADTADHIRDPQSEYFNIFMAPFAYRALYEFDLDKRRPVASRLSIMFTLFRLDAELNTNLNVEMKTAWREIDLDTPNWMIASAWDSATQ